MKFSWLLVMLLLAAVALFSVQNAGTITVRFLVWEIGMSAALVIQLAALLGAFTGLVIGACSRRRPKPKNADAGPAPAAADPLSGRDLR